MINQFLLICSAIIIYEFINYVEFINIVRSNIKIYKKILNLFKLKKVSDFRKEKLIFNYSKSLFIVSIKIIAILTTIFIFMLSLNLLSESFLDLVFSVFGIIEISVIFILTSLTLGLIIWILQAVSFLDIISEDGHSIATYFKFSLLNLPKIISKIVLLCVCYFLN